jgi:hypothetical protein
MVLLRPNFILLLHFHVYVYKIQSCIKYILFYSDRSLAGRPVPGKIQVCRFLQCRIMFFPVANPTTLKFNYNASAVPR